jgi:hypothetical protein
MIDKDMMVLQIYTNLEEFVPGPCGETYPTSDDANQTMNIKAEEVSDAEEEEGPVPITFPKIKAEPEVSCMFVCLLLGRCHRYAEMQVFFLISVSLSVHMKQLHAVDWILMGFFEMFLHNSSLLSVACDISLPFSFKQI